MAATSETALRFVERMFKHLSSLRTVCGQAIYELFEKLVSDFWEVSPPVRTEMFLQLVIATRHPLKWAEQGGADQGLAGVRGGRQLRQRGRKVLLLPPQLPAHRLRLHGRLLHRPQLRRLRFGELREEPQPGRPAGEGRGVGRQTGHRGLSRNSSGCPCASTSPSRASWS